MASAEVGREVELDQANGPAAVDRRRRVLLSPPDVGPCERAALLAAFDGGWIAPVGPDLAAFEAAVAKRTGVAYAVALASGTAAIHLALLELGVGPGDDVLVPTLTFAATANAVVHSGGRPCFVDAHPEDWNLSPDLLADELDERRRTGRRPAAVVAVDLYGQCADYARIEALCAEHEVPLLEDAAEAIGAIGYDGRAAGAFGAAGVFSFNGNKLITSSGGGMVVSDDRRLVERVRHLATQAREPAAHYEHVEVGWNQRLSNLLAALGRAQLESVDDKVARRRAVNARYRAELGGRPGVDFPPDVAWGTSTRWLSCLTLDPAVTGVGPEEVRLALDAENIEARPIWKPMHRQPVFATNPARIDGTSDALFATGLCLPSGSVLTAEEQGRVIDVVAVVLDCAGGD
jgi:dTDP-4-amino-4,6-dideoxygalactose transaminase